MSAATKRKHVFKEVLQVDLKPLEANQSLVRVLEGKGNNLHLVEDAEASQFLASMPAKFRKNVWVKRGDFVLIEHIPEGGKVKGEIVQVVTKEYKRFLKNSSLWPKAFTDELEQPIEEYENTNRMVFESESSSTEESDGGG